MRVPVGAAALGWCAAVLLACRLMLTIGGAFTISTCGTDAPRRQRLTDTVTTPPPSLRLELLAPAEVAAGEPVPITLQLTNTADRPLELHLVGRTIAFDVIIARADGGVVWRRLASAAVQGILQMKTLAPGETLELKGVWRQRDDAGQPVEPGTYTLQGVVPTDDPQPLRTPVARLRIRPR